MFTRRTPIAVFGGVTVAQPAISTVTFDAIGSVATAASAQTISLNMTVGPTANAMLIAAHFAYSGHVGFAVTWTVGATTQTLTPASTFDFLLTSDNGASAPAFALIGLLNPTPGAGTLTLSFTSAADAMVLEAATFINANTLGGLSGCFVAANFGTGTSASASSAQLPAIPGGIQCAFAGGVSSSPISWNVGTQMYKTSSGGNTWGAGVYQNATAATTFSLGINASVLWDAAWCVVNPLNTFPAGTLSINHANPITSGLTAAIPILGTGTLTDLVSGNTASTVGGSTDTSAGYGGGWAVPGGSTTAKADFGTALQPIQQGDFTALILWNPTVSATRGCAWGQCDAAPSNYACALSNASATSSATNGYMDGTVFTAQAGVDDQAHPATSGTMHVAKIDGYYHVWAFRNSAGTPSLWCDGANVTVSTVSLSGQTWTNGSQHFAIGNLGNYTGASFSAGCTEVVFLAWNRALSDAECASITANPFQVFL